VFPFPEVLSNTKFSQPFTLTVKAELWIICLIFEK